MVGEHWDAIERVPRGLREAGRLDQDAIDAFMKEPA